MKGRSLIPHPCRECGQDHDGLRHGEWLNHQARVVQGPRVAFETGSVRDTEAGKPDFTLIMWEATERLMAHLAVGAKKYGRFNWQKGQSMARAERSLHRHLRAYMDGLRDEDHLAAIVFNANMLMDHEERIARGELPASLDDRDEHRRGKFGS